MIKTSSRTRICSTCENNRILWASEDICAVCALELFRSRSLTDEQTAQIEESDNLRMVASSLLKVTDDA